MSNVPFAPVVLLAEVSERSIEAIMATLRIDPRKEHAARSLPLS